MPAGRDSFDPLMLLQHYDDTVAGSYPGPGVSPAGDQRPDVVRYAGDGTANLRRTTVTKHNDQWPTDGAGQRNVPKAAPNAALGFAGGVDEFDSVALKAPPQDKSLKHGKFDNPENTGAGG